MASIIPLNLFRIGSCAQDEETRRGSRQSSRDQDSPLLIEVGVERTFSMIKPDATERNLVGAITAMIEDSGLRIIASRRTRMTQEKAAEFYGVHSERPFFQSLCDFMCSGPIVVQVLEGENAVKKNREIMGATNPEDAEEGTIRKKHAVSLEKNSVHGSDSLENAAIEIAHFFSENEIHP